eukprot:403366825
MDWARLESSDDQDYDGEDESGSNNEDEDKTIKQKDQDIQGNLERSQNGLNSNAFNQEKKQQTMEKLQLFSGFNSKFGFLNHFYIFLQQLNTNLIYLNIICTI